jgi:hypothetical protein
MGIDTHTTPSHQVLGNAFEFADADEGWEIFDRAARLYLGMTGETFLKKYEAGDLPTDADNPDVALVEMLIPFACQ